MHSSSTSGQPQAVVHQRRDFLRYSAGAAAMIATVPISGVAQPQRQVPDMPQIQTMTRRPIPATDETVPVIGCGTYVGFDVALGSDAFTRLPAVLDALFAAGGSVIDSSPMYGRAEAVTGDLLAAAGDRSKAFIATKLWTRGRSSGIAQMEQSFTRLRTDRIDLMQIHNLLDWRTHLPTLRGWKEAGRVRYLGITHYTAAAYPEVEAVLRAERLDFLQINYALDDRAAADRVLPLARERGVAVIVNMPFGGGGLLRRLRDKKLPGWAAEIGCTSWAQVLLKFTLSHPAVTCVIPGTSRGAHMRENAAAGQGPAPDAAFWRAHAADVLE
jgi:aryl-alcohol dehydrogenase-like predicted oxidoreductase